MSADVHGDVWARGACADHAVNVATGGPPDWLRALLRSELDGALSAYPDETAAAMSIAHRHGRDPDEVVLLNGAAHGFTLIVETLEARRPVVVHPQFTEPDRTLAATGCPAAPVILSDPYTLDTAAIPGDADLVVIGNPTNPTGVLHPRAAIEAIMKPGRVVVVDEAFMDFVPEEPESLASSKDEGLIVVRSLTKILAVPGLRVGYLLAAPELARRLRDRRQAWPVNGLALAAARAAADHPERLHEAARRAQTDRAALHAAVTAALRDARVHDGAANFLLVELGPGEDATALAYALREHDGIAVRPAATFPGLTKRHLRVTARGGEADLRLVAALTRRATRPGRSRSAGS
ncbi:MAG TPA: Rv2231c family pyridoxal phosphate-dependent protein CobC [Baekduia sp.]|nr:Rv2231c family pyridoxal phosphate-dependent protein CobC [Baekduia sp.]